MSDSFSHLDLARLPTPCYVIDTARLEDNLSLLKQFHEASSAKVLLALKSFAMFHYGPLISRYLCGVCASGLHETRLGRTYFDGEVHTFSTAFAAQEIEEVLALSDHVIFNSFGQWQRYREQALCAKHEHPQLQFGLRINPEAPQGQYPLYDPSTPGSRLGIVREVFRPELLEGIDGLHFHTLCEQDVPPLARTLAKVEERFAEFLPRMRWINFGGGHHITRHDYQLDQLITLIDAFRRRWGVDVIIEPGEAVVLGAGVYVTEVLDLTWNAMPLAIIDGSCVAHLPDVLEMPYRPALFDAGAAGEKEHTYRIGGLSCLAGDIIGDYSFARPLSIGDRLMFMDMAHYTMVKTNTFNGVRLPAIVAWDSRDDSVQVVRAFGYEDFRMRLS